MKAYIFRTILKLYSCLSIINQVITGQIVVKALAYSFRTQIDRSLKHIFLLQTFITQVTSDLEANAKLRNNHDHIENIC